MAQPRNLKAKRSDRPALRDLVNFVVPQASPKWYYLGLQLFDPQDEGVLHRMKMEANKPLEEQCTEIFRHWLENKKNATWDELINSLKSKSVSLPILAGDIEKMLDTPSKSGLVRKLKRKFSRKSTKKLWPPSIKEGSSSFESSDQERINDWYFDDGDDVTTDEETVQASPRSLPRTSSIYSFHCKQASETVQASPRSLPRTSSIYSFHCKQASMPPGDYQESRFRLRSHSNASLPANLDQDSVRRNPGQRHRNLSEQNEYTQDELTNYLKGIHESERSERIKLQEQLRKADQDKHVQTIETYKERLENERLRKEGLMNENMQLKNQLSPANEQKDLSAIISKQVEDSEVFKEMYERINEVTRKLKDSDEAHKEEIYNLKCQVEELVNAKELNDDEKLQVKIEVLEKEKIKKLEDDNEMYRKKLQNLQSKVQHLKEQIEKVEENQLSLIYEKQETEQDDLQFTEKFESSIKRLYHKEHNAMYERQISTLTEEFYKELNTRDEICKKQISKLTNVFNKQLKDSEEAHRKELQGKVKELKGQEVKKIEDNKEAYEERIKEIKSEVEELKNVVQALKGSEEAHKNQMSEKEEKLSEEIDQLKNRLMVYEQQTSEQKDLQFTENFKDSIKNLCYIARDEIYEKQIIEKATEIFNEQLQDIQKTYREEMCNLKTKLEELSIEVAKPLEDTHRDNLHIETHEQEADELGDSEEAYREDRDTQNVTSLSGRNMNPECLAVVCKAPTCTIISLRKISGNQPLGGTMTKTYIMKMNLPGYEDNGIIQINYNFPRGIQGKEHPNPGEIFSEAAYVAYLPSSAEGNKVFKLLEKAFNAQLIFTVQANKVVWDDIDHKTSMHGGPTNNGYPDPEYLRKVLKQLAAKGIT